MYVRRLRLVYKTACLHSFDQNFLDMSYIFAHHVKFFTVFSILVNNDSIYSFIRCRSLSAFDSDFDKYVSRYCSNFSRFIDFQSRRERRVDFSTRQNFTHISTNKWLNEFFIERFISHFINLLVNTFVVKNKFIVVLFSWQFLMMISSSSVSIAFASRMSFSNVSNKACWRE